MGQRFVPITISVNGAAQGTAEVKSLSGAFNQLDAAGSRAASGGMKNSFDSFRLLRSELMSISKQLPIVDRLLNCFSFDLVRFAKQNTEAGGSFNKTWATAFNVF